MSAPATEPSQEFFWLLEAFPVAASVSVKPQYANKEVNGLTDDAWLAHWFAEGERDVALQVAARLPLPPGMEFRFTEHGFIQ